MVVCIFLFLKAGKFKVQKPYNELFPDLAWLRPTCGY